MCVCGKTYAVYCMETLRLKTNDKKLPLAEKRLLCVMWRNRAKAPGCVLQRSQKEYTKII